MRQAPLGAVECSEAGRALAKLGNPRPGVGVDAGTGLPDVLWCKVPAGLFLMGSTDRDAMAFPDEKPQHERSIPAPYRISRYPITNAQFAAFVEAGGYCKERYWTQAAREKVWSERKVKARRADEPSEGPHDFGDPLNLPNHPVVGVTWYEAVGFCLWLTEQLRHRGELGRDEEISLPTEPQWEKAARGPDGRVYPWGRNPDAERANYKDTGIGTTSPVGCFPDGSSPYDVEDLSGNVWEWCRTKRESKYGGYTNDHGLEGYAPRALRGGAFYNDAGYIRCAFRRGYDPYRRGRSLGFRVVVATFSSAP